MLINLLVELEPNTWSFPLPFKRSPRSIGRTNDTGLDPWSLRCEKTLYQRLDQDHFRYAYILTRPCCDLVPCMMSDKMRELDGPLQHAKHFEINHRYNIGGLDSVLNRVLVTANLVSRCKHMQKILTTKYII